MAGRLFRVRDCKRRLVLNVGALTSVGCGREIGGLERTGEDSGTILYSQRSRSSIHSTKTRPGADCGSDHELLITKFRLKLKKVGKTTRPFRYDLNQIPYDYTVEVRIDLRA